MIIPSALRADSGGKSKLFLDLDEGATLRTVIDSLGETFPRLERRLRDEAGDLRRFVNIFVGVEECRALDRQETALKEGDVVQILPSVAGG
ncbi:MoaD/ThiS family protein [Salininema proteolyticum]|uniref:MoaD/ThiS family protein n=1 Tax=Salininema proteolyticum TaxID=1607685 RepID=A0ABV8U4J1_9ACTN